jgi:hypothetical protein
MLVLVLVGLARPDNECNARLDSLVERQGTWDDLKDSKGCTEARRNEGLLLASAYVVLSKECPNANKFQTYANGGIVHIAVARFASPLWRSIALRNATTPGTDGSPPPFTAASLTLQPPLLQTKS